MPAAPAEHRTEVSVLAVLDNQGHAWPLIRRRGATGPDIATSDSTGRRIAASRVLTGLPPPQPVRPQPLNPTVATNPVPHHRSGLNPKCRRPPVAPTPRKGGPADVHILPAG
ncbi:hypothetical protein Vau01_123520 [Virgisporangium aurantiacum]|uniref:Uncharacterized protein n=1 Tax=Virgisporangium aurantiacum TaxID=175570 RepID=A0A8J3ZNK7_9ACTN|nr:hypothetical protein Vau01_123520 [Virgisporangium aurantiacum]